MSAKTILAPPSPEFQFYVYYLGRSDVFGPDGKPQPFYVGIGRVRPKRKQQRIDDHEVDAKSGRRGRRFSVIRKVKSTGGSVFKIVESWHISEADVRRREVELIAEIGRKDNDKGPLVNLTDGGDGVLNPGTETRRKMREGQLRNIEEKRAAGKKHAPRSIPIAVEARKKRWAEDKEFRESTVDRLRDGQRWSRENNPERHHSANEIRSQKSKAWASANRDKMQEIWTKGVVASAMKRKTDPAYASSLEEKRIAGFRRWAAENPEKARENAIKAARSTRRYKESRGVGT